MTLGFDGAPRRVVRQREDPPNRGHGRRGQFETLPQVCPAASGGFYRPSAHGPPLDTGRSIVRSGQAATMGGPRKRSIRRRIAANSARGTATSASWKTTYRPCRTIRAPDRLDLGHHPERPGPALRLVAEAGEEDLRLLQRPADGPRQQVADPLLQNTIGRQADSVADTLTFQPPSEVIWAPWNWSLIRRSKATRSSLFVSPSRIRHSGLTPLPLSCGNIYLNRRPMSPECGFIWEMGLGEHRRDQALQLLDPALAGWMRRQEGRHAISRLQRQHLAPNWTNSAGS